INANIQSVTMILILIPILSVYPFVQRYFVSGIMLGSVKG
ncbi:MAG: carbohydrate ABC transporter permease, partial [Brachybacterium tyrofermentans]